MAELLDKTMEVGAGIADSLPEPRRIKAAFNHCVEEGVDDVRRVLHRGRRVAEDLVEDAVHNVKKYPLQTVAATFGIAFGAGLLIGWFARRR